MSLFASSDAAEPGTRAFHHPSSHEAEHEYDRLRALARHEQDQRALLSSQSQEAYQRGDGAAAHQLSLAAKEHLTRAEQYNEQASEYIFRENNAPGRVTADTIDLHGQTVVEAERILEQRIRYAQQHGQTHLHVIVGKGHHSTNHAQKIKPRVEQVCQQLGLHCSTEMNTGRIYINLRPEGTTTSPAPHHPVYSSGASQPSHSHPMAENHPSGTLPEEREALVDKLIAKVVKKSADCCAIM